jgi:hypothetical protein
MNLLAAHELELGVRREFLRVGSSALRSRPSDDAIAHRGEVERVERPVVG